MSANLKEFIFWWNNSFPLDRIYREKYNIPFNSKKHRKLSQIDILLDLLEDKLFREYYKDQVEQEKRLKEYEQGKMFNISSAEEEDRFNKFIPLKPEKAKIIKKPKPGDG